LMTFDGTCERGGFQRAPQEIEKIPPDFRFRQSVPPVPLGGAALRSEPARQVPCVHQMRGQEKAMNEAARGSGLSRGALLAVFAAAAAAASE
jgi:hypothetical protein